MTLGDVLPLLLSLGLAQQWHRGQSLAPAPAIVVDPVNGRDTNVGSVDAPFQSLERGILAARLQVGHGGSHERRPVQIRAGRVYLVDPLRLGPADNGLTLEAFPGEEGNVTLVGGLRLSSWSPHSSIPGTWVHTAPQDTYSRQLFVNGVRANRTVAPSPLPGEWIFGNASIDETVYETDNTALLSWRNIGDIEFVFRARGLFTEQRCTWKSVTSSPDGTKVQVRVKHPCMLNVKLSTGGGAGSSISPAQTDQDPQTLPTPASPLIAKRMDVVRTENIYDTGTYNGSSQPAIGFAMAKAGTWYFDRQAHQILYKPRPGDDMNSADCVMPVLEQLIVGRGQLPARPLRNITLSGITFAYSTWLGPNSKDGYVPQQAAVRLIGSTTSVLHGTGPHNSHAAPTGDLAPVTGMPCQNLNCEPTPGALSFHSTVGLTVRDCTFEHLGSAALYIGNGAQHSHIVGNEFADISAGAIAVGHVDSWDVSDPAQQEAYNTIEGNYLHDIAVEYAGAAGIWQGFWRDSKILNNTMIRLGYSGVHLGWGWRLAQGYSRNNEVAFNRIRHHLMLTDDGGGLYTSGPQPNTTIHHNYVSKRQHNKCGACMYRDDGSAYIVDSFNVCDMPSGHHGMVFYFMSGGSPQNTSRFCSTHDLTIRNTFTNSLAVMNHTYNTVIEDTVDCTKEWPAEALAIMRSTGYSDDQAQRSGWPRFPVPWPDD